MTTTSSWLWVRRSSSGSQRAPPASSAGRSRRLQCATSAPSASKRCAHSTPIRPMPMMPTRRPASSPPPRRDTSSWGHSPSRTRASAQASQRRTAYDAPTHHSATLTALAPAAFAAGTPAAARASVSSVSTPTLGCWTKASRGAAATSSPVTRSAPVQSPTTISASPSAAAAAAWVRSAGTTTSSGRSPNSALHSSRSSGASASSRHGVSLVTAGIVAGLHPVVTPAPLVTAVTSAVPSTGSVPQPGGSAMPARETSRSARPQRPLWRRSTGIGVAALLAVAVTASASGISLYRIKPGDTLSAIAARYHTSVAELIRLNNLPGNGNLIIAGHTLRLPRGSHAGAATHRVVTTYVVRPGDSLYAIAGRQHASWRAIARANHLPSSLMVVIGQRLRIPHWVHSAPSHLGSGSSGGSPADAGFGNRWVPSRDSMAATIRATASRWGVDSHLALGISYEESGFNQRNVSVAGAIGAMQVMPSTGAFVGQAIVHRHLDLLSASDNATAGVALLAVLLRETHCNERLAVAGYSQGLASVRSRGMYSDTKQYVANVLALRNRF